MEKIYKTLVEFGKNQEIELEVDIEWTWKDDFFHAYGLWWPWILSLIISLNGFFGPTLA